MAEVVGLPLVEGEGASWVLGVDLKLAVSEIRRQQRAGEARDPRRGLGYHTRCMATPLLSP